MGIYFKKPFTTVSTTHCVETYKSTGEVAAQYDSQTTMDNLVHRQPNGPGGIKNGWKIPSGFGSGYALASSPKGKNRRSLSFPPRWLDYGGVPYSTRDLVVQSDYLSSPAQLFPVVPNNTIARAETEVINKLQDGNCNLAVFAAEAKESLGMLGSTAIVLASAYRAARRGNWRQVTALLSVGAHNFKSARHDIGGRWLELQYGWLPLMSDIHDIYNMFTKRLRDDIPLRVVRMVGGRDSYDKPAGILGIPATRHKATYSTKIILWYKIDDLRVYNASRMGLLNPLEVVWEKIPYSFVVDWMFPIGNVISATTGTLGLSFISGTRTDFVTEDITAREEYSLDEETYYNEQTIKCRSYNRLTYRSFPTPTPYMKSPLSGLHALNALALINNLKK